MVAAFVSSDVSIGAAEPLPSIVERARSVAWLGRDGARTAVWLDGEHDIATVALLADTLARAIFLDDADVARTREEQRTRP